MKLFDPNEREIKKLHRTVEQINQLEPSLASLSAEQIVAKTDELKRRRREGVPLDDLLPEAYALVREASKRTIGLRHFDVQLVGGIVLHQGRIAEMKTGEGKTLVATLPLYLNALDEQGCHLVTVNDYLAKRDALWMGPIYLALGLSVGVVQHGRRLESYRVVMREGKSDVEACSRREAYACDITYGTNNEFGFDYLRDNMAVRLSQINQRELHYAIVDEVDSILIDEARTPLIISGISDKPTDHYYRFARIIPRLKNEEDYTLDEKARAVSFTDKGIEKVERELGVQNLTDPEHLELLHHANCALKAHVLMKRDVDYVVKEGQVVIVDEFTGRLMYGRRFSEGLHQAIEAKEGVKIEHESQTLAAITFQNYFRLYRKVAGMTGTAKTEEGEFRKIYGLDVVVIPTHRPMIRQDHVDMVYASEAGKFAAIVDEILECHAQGRPVLVGTRSVEKSEKLSTLLHQRGIVRADWKKYPEEKIDELRSCHFVLNAKEHEHEAKIIARAGRKGAVTIATNMAGRGVDIVLDPEVKELEGLHIVGSERHESRRIDNQLRGRSGRQGDPGSSRFFVSLEDELIRIFGGERVKNLMERFGFTDETPIDNKLVARQIENAQKKVESIHFESRKYVLEYDNVMEHQRKVVYGERRKILKGVDLKSNIEAFVEDLVEELVQAHLGEEEGSASLDVEGVVRAFAELFPLEEGALHPEALSELPPAELSQRLVRTAKDLYNVRESELGAEYVRQLERQVFLHVLDKLWIEHLDAMDYLRDGINLRAYGHMDPLVAYKKEAFELFEQFRAQLKEDVVRWIFRVQEFHVKENLYQPQRYISAQQPAQGQGAAPKAAQTVTAPVQSEKVPRNAPCPCGSGKKYKKCCGQAA